VYETVSQRRLRKGGRAGAYLTPENRIVLRALLYAGSGLMIGWKEGVASQSMCGHLRAWRERA
jgi:hypothetical protein